MLGKQSGSRILGKQSGSRMLGKQSGSRMLGKQSRPRSEGQGLQFAVSSTSQSHYMFFMVECLF